MRPNRAQLYLRNKYTFLSTCICGTVALKSFNKNFSGELYFCSWSLTRSTLIPIFFLYSLERSLGSKLVSSCSSVCVSVRLSVWSACLFHLDWIFFHFFTGFFLLLGLVVFLITRNNALRFMKNFDLNIEIVLFLK